MNGKKKTMNEKEEIIYQSIKKNPYISQQELADILDLSRPTVANLISGLIKKRLILGKAYLLNEPKQIVCIGGANVDRKYYMREDAQLGTSNPVRSTQSAGGVARNVGENLGRLGKEVVLLTACGIDNDWEVIEKMSEIYLNLDYVSAFPTVATGSYTAVLEKNGELMIALADMEAYESLTPGLLKANEALLSRSNAIVADLNCPKETLEYIANFAEVHRIPFVLAPVSSLKMVRMPANLEHVEWLICNRDETESYFNIKINTKDEWKKAVERWLALGISNVVITNGREGAVAGNAINGIIHEPAIQATTVQDVTGAGDAFCAAVIYAWLEGKSLPEILKIGSVNAVKTLQSSFTVRPNLSISQLQKDLEELI